MDQSDDTHSKTLFEEFALNGVIKTYLHQEIKSLILARNFGLNHVRDCEFSGFLDDDLELFPDFFEKLLAPFQNDPEFKLAAGMGTPVGETRKSDIFAQFFLQQHYGNGKFMPHGLPTFPYGLEHFTEVEFVAGGATLYRNEIIQKYRFDERLIGYGYGDDIDVSFRISRKYKNFFEPKARYKHDIGSPGRDPGFKFRKQQIQNFYYLLRKNVGLTPKSISAFSWYCFGQLLDDSRNLRRSALKGCLAGIINVARGRLDSVRSD